MFCVIQQVMRKKPDTYGEPLAIVAYQNKWRLDESKPFTWTYEYSKERFERPHLEAYKITLHQSYREGGAVKKRQFSVCTMSYYDVCDSWWGDFIVGGEKALAEKVGVDPGVIGEAIESKLEPLRKRLEAEFHQSPEYLARQDHERILADYMAKQDRFCSRYGVDKDDYSRCYDVFGALKNREYLEQIKAEHKARKENERRYQETWRSTYERHTGGSYSVSSASTYTEDEKGILRQFYKSLSKTYHPDLNPGKDTTAAMQLLNRLKETWGL